MKKTGLVLALLLLLGGFLMRVYHIRITINCDCELESIIMVVGILTAVGTVIQLLMRATQNAINNCRKFNQRIWYACERLEQLAYYGKPLVIERGSMERYHRMLALATGG